MKLLELVFGLFLMLLNIATTFASVPKLINFQGILKDGSGNPVADGSYSVTFSIYITPTGGVNLWTETQSVTTVGGLFAVLLGSSNPVPDTVFKGSDRWLGIAVSPDPEMAVRQQLVSVGYSYRVNSVDSAAGGTITSKLSIGPGHTNTGADAFVAGANNFISGNYATIGGGVNNRAGGDFSVVAGGGGNQPVDSNVAAGNNSTVSGGLSNRASGFGSTIGGGYAHTASGTAATIGGGGTNTASGPGATVCGGSGNVTSGQDAVVCGGAVNTASGSEAAVGGGTGNTASAEKATVGGGGGNSAGNLFATVGGGFGNTANGFAATAGGGRNNRVWGDYSVIAGGGGPLPADSNSALDAWTAIGGGLRNKATGFGSSIAGGVNNFTSGNPSTIGGGSANSANFDYSTVSGGFTNSANALAATVAGGTNNIANGQFSFVGSGRFDTASGQYATVPGGYASKASGDYSFAAGQQAKAIHNGSFVWADDRSADFASTAIRQFSIRAQNGVRLADTAGAAKAVAIGELYRDNSIVAWGRVDGFAGALNTDYGVSSFTKNSTGNYTINLNAVAVNFNNIIPVASIELNVPPDGIAANIRHIFVDQVTASQFNIHITNGSYAPADSYFTFIVTGR